MKPPKDVSEFFEHGHTEEEFIAALTNAELLPQVARTPLFQVVEDPNETPPSRPAFTVRSESDLDNLPDPTWLVNGVLHLDSLAMLYGPPGASKTFLAIDLSCYISTGRAWHTGPVRRGRVLYIALEGTAGLKLRMHAWRRHYGHTATGVCFVWDHLLLREPESVDSLLAAISQETFPQLIVIDTVFRALAGGDENSAEDMGRLIRGADHLRRQTGACVLLVHHPGRNGNHGRGHSSLDGALDTILKLEDDGGTRILTIEKQKDAECIGPLRLSLQQVPESGSCVLVPATYGSAGQRARNGQLTDKEMAALITLHEIVHGEETVPITHWQSSCVAIRRSTFYKVVKQLLDGGLVEKIEGKYRLSGIGRGRAEGHPPF